MEIADLILLIPTQCILKKQIFIVIEENYSMFTSVFESQPIDRFSSDWVVVSVFFLASLLDCV